MHLRLITPSTASIIATSDIKSHLNIDISNDDVMLGDLVKVAERYVENYTQRQFLTATWEMKLDHFPSCDIKIPRPPLQSVAITYIDDDDGSTVTLSSSLYRVLPGDTYGRIEPAYNETWPATRSVGDAVTITITAGATGSSAVPLEAKQAVKMLAAHWYVNRTAVVTGTITQMQEMALQALLGNLSVGDYA